MRGTTPVPFDQQRKVTVQTADDNQREAMNEVLRLADGMMACQYAYVYRGPMYLETKMLSSICTGSLHRDYISRKGRLEALCFSVNIRDGFDAIPSVEDKKKLLFGRTKKGKAYHTFLDWLLTDDFYGNAFLTKHVMEALNHGVLVNLDAPIYVVQPALVMLRRMYEFSHKVQFWYELVRGGCHPRSAALIAEALERINEESPKYFFAKLLPAHKAFNIGNDSDMWAATEELANNPDLLYRKSLEGKRTKPLANSYRWGFVSGSSSLPIDGAHSNSTSPAKDIPFFYRRKTTYKDFFGNVNESTCFQGMTSLVRRQLELLAEGKKRGLIDKAFTQQEKAK
jgi:hypothetical protein